MLFQEMQIENDTALHKTNILCKNLILSFTKPDIRMIAFMKLNIIVNLFSVDLLTFKCNRKLACNFK